MNLQQTIRRILREDKDHTNLLKGIIDSSDIFDYKHFCGFDIITPEERSDQYNFLNKNKIPYLIKVYFVGGPNSEVWPRTQAIRNKELDLMEELHEYIKSFVPFNIEMMGSHVNSCDGYKKLMKRKYTTDDLQESIKRILREEDYSPAGKEIIPNSIIVHKSNPMFRDKIMEQGLKVRAGECYKIYVGYGVKCKPAIFATNSTNKKAWFDSTYDDDIWFIDTRMIPDVKWYKDRHFESRSKHIVTFQDIPKEAITLKYEGTGSGDVEKWDKDSPNIVRESIKKVLKEETRFNKMGEEKYKSCSMSDITRMELIDTFLTNTEKDPQFNLEEPNYDMLIDDWDGYDDQVYIQNKLDEDRIIFYEGWVYSCWEAIKTKSEYKGMNKREVIESIIRKRFPRIAEEFNMVIEDYGYFNEGDGYIMYVILKKNMNIQESIRRVLREDTEGIDSFLDEISSKHNMSDELKDFVKQFIEESDCKRINFSRFKMGVMGLALESGVLINSVALNHPLPFLLFLIFHEVAHQYQFKKYGEDVMYDCYLGEISEREAAEFMKHTEEVADDFASRKIRQLQKLNLIGPYTPPQMYKNVPIQQITMMVNNYRNDMRIKNIDSPKKVSEYFYNMVKSEL